MSKPKEILKEITEAAAEAMLFHPHDGNYTRLAEAALKAADVPEMLARIAELEAKNHEALRLLSTRVSAHRLDDAMARIAELEAANAKLKARLGKELGWVNN